MKSFLFGIATFLFSLFVWLFCHDYNLHHIYYEQLRHTAEEASVAAAMFTDTQSEKRGQIVFNRAEGEKVVHAMLKIMLKTDDNLVPLETSYWRDQIEYKAYYFDDSNTNYPIAFTDPDTGYKFMVQRPTVIITINAGKARYTIDGIVDNVENIRSAAHEWKYR